MDFEYKVVPAPRRVKRVKGVKDTPDLFAVTLTEAINEEARHGWEYLRAETLVAEDPGGWFRRGGESEQAVLVFRRPREAAGPRLAAVRGDPVVERAPARGSPPVERAPARAADRAADRATDRLAARADEPEPEPERAPRAAPGPRSLAERIPAGAQRRGDRPRIEPIVGGPRHGEPAEPQNSLLRPVPRLGPAEKP